MIDRNVGIGHRRLSIIDLSRHGRQPMSTPDGRYWIAYNGETYNFHELRAELESRGHRFESSTDTEVVLRLYTELGPAMLDRLNGMFALAVWDSKERSLLIVRDRLGVKPLFYALHKGAFYFASEPKALFAAGVPCEFDERTWEELLLFRYVSGEGTPFRGVRRLLPGHYLVWKDGRITMTQWWDLAAHIEERRNRPGTARDYPGLLQDAVRLRLVGDVPVGVLLSGGIDSSSLLALTKHSGAGPVGGFSCQFAERGYDEGAVAVRVCERLGAECRDRVVSRSELLPLLRKATWFNDGPVAHSSDAHLYAISERARSNATVLLSGEAADETLGGYVRYRPFLLPSFMGEPGRAAARVLSVLGANERFGKLGKLLGTGGPDDILLYNACETWPADLAALGMQSTAEFSFRRAVIERARRLYDEPVRQAMFCDQLTFLGSLLDRNDRMTMGTSIECRIPFLDHRLVALAGTLPTRDLVDLTAGKKLLRRAMRSVLPAEVVQGRKWGFGVPWHQYLRDVPELRELVTQLPLTEPVASGPLDRRRLVRCIDDFMVGRSTHASLIFSLLAAALWREECVAPWTAGTTSRRAPEVR